MKPFLVNFGSEDILSTDLDMAEIARGKYDFDVVGHYARPDVFQLLVNERETPAMVVTGVNTNDENDIAE